MVRVSFCEEGARRRSSIAAPQMSSAPALPVVDSHIEKDDLKYKKMRNALRKEKWVSKRHLDEDAGRERRVSHRDTDRRKIRAACAYIDKKFGNGDGEISLTELEKVFRDSRRQSALQESREKGRALVRRLKILMESRDMTLIDFINKMDGSTGTSNDGKITMIELKTGLKLLSADSFFLDYSQAKYHDSSELVADMAARAQEINQKRKERSDAALLIQLEHEASSYDASYIDTMISQQNCKGVLTFSENDIVEFIRFLDPDADGDLSLEEINKGYEEALRLRPKIKQKNDYAELGANIVISRFETEMHKKNLRITDLFRVADRDGSGSISVTELEGLMSDFCGPSARQRALAKIKSQKIARAKADTKRSTRAAAELEARRKTAEAAGAPEALARIDAVLRERDFRVSDLFSKAGFDLSGDGRLDADELFVAFDTAGLRLRKPELVSLVKFIDKTGDGSVDAQELESALRRNRRDFGNASYQDASLRRRANKSKPPSHLARGPLGLEFDPGWLTSLDLFLCRHCHALNNACACPSSRSQDAPTVTGETRNNNPPGLASCASVDSYNNNIIMIVTSSSSS